MLYLNEKHLRNIGLNWNDTTEVIANAVSALSGNDYAQPIKPYLRFGNPANRIIAMPAYVGADVKKAGIKWIAGFPDNIKKGMPRASSVVIVNNAGTGAVEAVINTALLSIVRTASVSGFMIERYLRNDNRRNLEVGITGFGPIGQNHMLMMEALFGERVARYRLYDKRPVIPVEEIRKSCRAEVELASGWEEVYENSDIFICCTVADRPYIDRAPKEDALIMNVSLRDFKPETYPYFKDTVIVDDWEEVCRENTVIELWNQQYGLSRRDVLTMTDVLDNDAFARLKKAGSPIFCPMGLAVFDIAVAAYYCRRAEELGIGLNLEE